MQIRCSEFSGAQRQRRQLVLFLCPLPTNFYEESSRKFFEKNGTNTGLDKLKLIRIYQALHIYIEGKISTITITNSIDCLSDTCCAISATIRRSDVRKEP